MSFRHKCSSFSRFLIIIINAGTAVFALAIIGLVLWIRFDANFERSIRVDLQNTNPNPPDLFDIKTQIRTAILVSFYVIIGFSAASLVLSMIGICSAVIQNRKLYIFFMSLLVVIVLLEIAVGIFIIVYQHNIRNTINVYTSLSFQYNTRDATSLMERYSCCGDGTNNPYNQQCLQLGRQVSVDCPTAVWERLSQHLMIAGFVLLGIVLANLLNTMFTLIVILNYRYRTLVD